MPPGHPFLRQLSRRLIGNCVQGLGESLDQGPLNRDVVRSAVVGGIIRHWLVAAGGVSVCRGGDRKVNSMVVYGSRSVNTQRVAEAIAGGLEPLGSVHLVAVDDAGVFDPAAFDLIVVGGPTEAHGMTPSVALFFARMRPGALKGTAATAFDTRMRWPRWVSGSAARAIQKQLDDLGASPIASPESFFVHGWEPALQRGELERAAAWGASVAAKASLRSRAAI